MSQKLRIGDVATRSGVTRDTIRFYERSGLLDTPARSSSRHRIGDIKELLFLRDSDDAVASKRLEILRRRLVILEERIGRAKARRLADPPPRG